LTSESFFPTADRRPVTRPPRIGQRIPCFVGPSMVGCDWITQSLPFGSQGRLTRSRWDPSALSITGSRFLCHIASRLQVGYGSQVGMWYSRMDCSGLICLVLRSVIWIAPSFGSLSRTSLNPSQNESGLSHLVLISSWIALLFKFGSPRHLPVGRPVVYTTLYCPVVWIAPSLGSLRCLDCPVLWIAPDAPSFGSLQRVSVIWTAPLSF